MNKEKYLEPHVEVVEFVWTAALCLSGGTEAFGTDDDLVYPNDFWD